MTDTNGGLKRKCTEIENDLPEKRRPDETTDSNNPKKITDINQFCLEKIFNHLNLEDLLNVADSNKHLKLATRMPFIWNYAGKSILIEKVYLWDDEDVNLNEKITMKTNQPTLYEEDIRIVDVKASFQMIRCFGGMITELNLSCDSTYTRTHGRIVRYINKFCGDSLKKATFSEVVGFERFTKPFVNVEDLTIDFLCKKNREKCLSRLFPNLNRLNFMNCHVKYLPFIYENFPNLRHLGFGGYVYLSDNLIEFLRLNPNLRSLRIGLDDFHTFKRISELYLQSIESLDITEMEAEADDSSIYFPNVTKFRFDNSVYGHLPRIPFSFNQLKELEIHGELCNSDTFLALINENRMVERFTFSNPTPFKVIVRGQLEAAFPALKDIIYEGMFDETEELLPLALSNLEFLRTFSIRTNDTDEQIRAGCGDKWQINRLNEMNLYSNVRLDRIGSIV